MINGVLKDSNNKSIITARFIGRDKSMGFLNGEVYIIKTWLDYRNRLFRKPKLFLFVSGDGNMCAYSSLETMLNNWELV